MKGVYFILDEQANAIKIGYSGNIEKRLNDLQIGNPTILRLIAHWQGGGQRDEAYLHDLFSNYRLNGEWFEAIPVQTFLRLTRGNVIVRTYVRSKKQGIEDPPLVLWILLILTIVTGIYSEIQRGTPVWMFFVAFLSFVIWLTVIFIGFYFYSRWYIKRKMLQTTDPDAPAR